SQSQSQSQGHRNCHHVAVAGRVVLLKELILLLGVKTTVRAGLFLLPSSTMQRARAYARGMMQHVAQRFTDFALPFSLPQLEDLRYHILTDMGAAGFPHYRQQLQDLVEAIDRTLGDPVALADSDHWLDASRQLPYWQ